MGCTTSCCNKEKPVPDTHPVKKQPNISQESASSAVDDKRSTPNPVGHRSERANQSDTQKRPTPADKKDKPSQGVKQNYLEPPRGYYTLFCRNTETNPREEQSSSFKSLPAPSAPTKEDRRYNNSPDLHVPDTTDSFAKRSVYSPRS